MCGDRGARGGSRDRPTPGGEPLLTAAEPIAGPRENHGIIQGGVAGGSRERLHGEFPDGVRSFGPSRHAIVVARSEAVPGSRLPERAQPWQTQCFKNASST
jgi:hypothetical protein